MKTSKSKTGIIIFMIIALSSFKSMAQDFHFSQYRETPMLLNPAQTALQKDIRIIANYRDQWKTVASPFKTYAISGEFAINRQKNEKRYLAIGFQILSDKAGDSRMGTTVGLLSLNSILKIADYHRLSVGLVGGVGQRSVSTADLKWGSQYDGTSYVNTLSSGEAINGNNKSFADLGGGICWNYSHGERYISAEDGIKATVGVSAFHYSLPKYSFQGNSTERLNTKLIVHGSLSVGMENTNTMIIPEFLYVRQGSLQEINIGAIYKFIIKEESKYTRFNKASAFSIGTHYRVKDALIFTTLFEYTNYSVGFSYDVNLSQLTNVSKAKGGLEISLKFVTPNPFGGGRSRI